MHHYVTLTSGDTSGTINRCINYGPLTNATTSGTITQSIKCNTYSTLTIGVTNLDAIPFTGVFQQSKDRS